jgi:CDP-glucose 4,6-dehydratase
LPAAKDVTVVRGSLEDLELLERAMNEYEIETVLHLGAQTIVGIANRNPISTFTANIQGTWNIMEAARRSPTVKRIVVASSDKAYGDHDKLPYDENSALQGKHPYDVSKSCSDLIAQSYYKSFGSPVAITRCGNFYGGGDLNWNRIIPGTIRSLLREEAPIIRSDGTFIRDYFYVKDGVHSYLTLAEQMDKKGVCGEAFNFSNEIQVNVKDLVGRVAKVMGKNIQPKVLNEAKNEIKHQYLDASKAKKVLGWQPLFTLEQGLDETIHWYKEFLGKR